MINQETQFKLQAYLDGELGEAEAAEVKSLLGRDAEAAALLKELNSTNAALAGHEDGLKLAETREFYWSIIQREIQHQSRPAAAVKDHSWRAWLQRHFLPVGGVAALACLLGLLGMHSSASGGEFGEIDLASDDMGTYTFRDQSEQMTMVWFYDRSADSQFTAATPVASLAQK